MIETYLIFKWVSDSPSGALCVLLHRELTLLVQQRSLSL